MPFKKGKSGNPTGRTPGAKNKAGTELREKITDFLSNRFKDIVEDFDALSPPEKHKIYTALLPYGLSKMQELTLEDQFRKMSDEQLDEVIDVLKRHASNEQTAKN